VDAALAFGMAKQILTSDFKPKAAVSAMAGLQRKTTEPLWQYIGCLA
jgi:hypothetical protein